MAVYVCLYFLLFVWILLYDLFHMFPIHFLNHLHVFFSFRERVLLSSLYSIWKLNNFSFTFFAVIVFFAWFYGKELSIFKIFGYFSKMFNFFINLFLYVLLYLILMSEIKFQKQRGKMLWYRFSVVGRDSFSIKINKL